MVANISSCVESIRMVRDKVQRDQVWSSLGGWAIELLVERALFSAGRNLSPSSALMRIMEVVASGLLMPDGQGIKDPCEREETSVFSHMTLQMKEDVTKQAQLELRNIHYRSASIRLQVYFPEKFTLFWVWRCWTPIIRKNKKSLSKLLLNTRMLLVTLLMKRQHSKMYFVK